MKEFCLHTGNFEKNTECTDGDFINCRDKFFINVSFKEFADENLKKNTYLGLYGKKILNGYRKSDPSEEKYKNAPTFKEFIDFILDLPIDNLDPHWCPLYLQCMPCHIRYDIIGR